MVNISPIRTEEDYRYALKELSRVFHAKKGTPDGDLLELLSVLVTNYEDEHYPIPPSDPIEAIKFRMDQQGLNQSDLAKIIGYRSRVSDILNRRRRLTLPMIRKLSESLQIDAGVLVTEYELAQ